MHGGGQPRGPDKGAHGSPAPAPLGAENSALAPGPASNRRISSAPPTGLRLFHDQTEARHQAAKGFESQTLTCSLPGVHSVLPSCFPVCSFLALLQEELRSFSGERLFSLVLESLLPNVKLHNENTY